DQVPAQVCHHLCPVQAVDRPVVGMCRSPEPPTTEQQHEHEHQHDQTNDAKATTTVVTSSVSIVSTTQPTEQHKQDDDDKDCAHYLRSLRCRSSTAFNITLAS